MSRAVSRSLLLGAVALFLFGLLRHLSAPLFWHDEGDTAVFAERILEAGYPKVHGRNVLFEGGTSFAQGVKESVDAYLGKTWGDFYFAVPGVWWAQRVEDPYARTFRVRLPFALAGAAGIGVWLWAVLPALPRARRALFAAAYLALCTLSISLLLHLREARYYALLVLVLGVLAGAHLRHLVLGAMPWRRYFGLTALGGAALFHVFFAAWPPVLALLALDAARAAWPGAPDARARRLARALAPHALALVLTLPALLFFETFGLASRFAAEQGAGVASFAANLRMLLAHFLRQEWLAAALVMRAGCAALARGAAPERQAATRAARAISTRLLLFAAGYAVAGCMNPVVYERYFVALSPALALAALLDAWSAAALLEGAPRARRRAFAAACAALLALSLFARREALAGRLAELREPVRGPLDFAVAHLRERYPQPERLLIASNYEAQPLMFYLGSRVIVGLAQGDIENEPTLEPDVVIPRRRWPRSLAALRPFVARGSWQEERLPVLDTHYNNVPSLTPSPATPDPHRFRTPQADPGALGSLRVFHRLEADS
jgi:hypothetical protein